MLATWFLLYGIVRRRLPDTAWFYRCAAVAGVLSVFCLECGWIVTEVGRQPWIVYAHRFVDPDLEDYFRTRTILAAIVVGLIAAVGVLVLRADAPVFHHCLLSSTSTSRADSRSTRWRST